MEFNVTWNQQNMQLGKLFGQGTKKYRMLPEFVNWILKSTLQNRVPDRLLSITMWWRVYGKRQTILKHSNEVFSIIHAEESWKGVMLDPPPVDGSTMIVKKPRGGAKPNGTNHNVNMEQGRQESMKNLTKKKLRCSYSKKACHTKEKCGKLHGKPQGLNQGDGMRSSYFLHHNYFLLFNRKYFFLTISFYLIKIAKLRPKQPLKDV